MVELLFLPTSAVLSAAGRYGLHAAGRYGLHATVLAYDFAFIPLAILARCFCRIFCFLLRGLHDGYLAGCMMVNVVAVVLTPLLLRYHLLPSCTVPERVSNSNLYVYLERPQ